MGNSFGIVNANVDRCRHVLCTSPQYSYDNHADYQYTTDYDTMLGDVINVTSRDDVIVREQHASYDDEGNFTYYPDSAEERASAEFIAHIEAVLLTKFLPAICVFGIVGNWMTLMLLVARWRRQIRRSRLVAGLWVMGERHVATTDILSLMALMASDLLLCLVLLPHAGTDLGQGDHRELSFHVYYQLLADAVINTFIMAGTWLTVVMTLNRYLHLCHPMWGLRAAAPRCMLVLTAAVVVFSLVFNIPRFWQFRIGVCDCAALATTTWQQYSYQSLHPAGEGDDVAWQPAPTLGDAGNDYDGSSDADRWRYYIEVGALTEAALFHSIYQWSYFVLGILAPLLLLAFCNVMLVRTVFSSANHVEQWRGGAGSSGSSRGAGASGNGSCNARGERTLITRTLISIVVFYLLLVSPTEMIKFFKSHLLPNRDAHSVAVYNLVVSVLNVLQAVNFACNFIPYLLLDKTCRRMCTSLYRGATYWERRRGRRDSSLGRRVSPPDGHSRYYKTRDISFTTKSYEKCSSEAPIAMDNISIQPGGVATAAKPLRVTDMSA